MVVIVMLLWETILFLNRTRNLLANLLLWETMLFLNRTRNLLANFCGKKVIYFIFLFFFFYSNFLKLIHEPIISINYTQQHDHS